MQLRDDAEPAESADLKLGEIVSGDVLHHLAAGFHQSAIASCDGAAQQMIPYRAEAVPEWSRSARGDDGAETSVRATGRIHREPHSLVGQAAA